mmetsp:Transcript_27070/g.20254  ORF Transcript_27070/g.20254 Transcript_27070/m.20254 type:complete len:87 (+) Transcript_27070:787-1047(+)
MQGATMNDMKKEMQLIAECVAAMDPRWQEASLAAAEKLGRLLMKSQEEMHCILVRNNMIEKKKKRKAELDKVVALVKSKVEIEFAT